jgi:hypothetical protein
MLDQEADIINGFYILWPHQTPAVATLGSPNIIGNVMSSPNSLTVRKGIGPLRSPPISTARQICFRFYRPGVRPIKSTGATDGEPGGYV